ncbi:uncharacterized protein EDB91DRAFT_1108343 [Suillus paluster]|uniref:uncharacterized protein n=1 Tax=Suillus paluster TaxID=48578 RepID=UPI001B8868D5|nr:uncharacterized protein EDB91DRAFT_1108343 [Suillus paluster]KAG1750598.1 hypothetical protein EDB91DRAFT_1108343 [Suillus paluster]
MMLTSRSMMFALLSFLAGANACVSCPSTLTVNGVVVKQYNVIPIAAVQITYCEYMTSDGTQITCDYHTETGKLYYGSRAKNKIVTPYNSCPRTATLKDGHIC